MTSSGLDSRNSMCKLHTSSLKPEDIFVNNSALHRFSLKKLSPVGSRHNKQRKVIELSNYRAYAEFSGIVPTKEKKVLLN